MTDRIPFIKPKFPPPEELTQDLKRIYHNNYYSNNGPIYFEFKEALEKYLDQGMHAVIVSNATMGLMVAIQAAIKSDDHEKKYIAIPSFTFAAGPLAIRWSGYEPLFFDIDPVTAQPSLQSFQEVLKQHGSELAGVVLINEFGIGNEEVEKWERLLEEQRLPFIIDSAPGFGSTYADGSLLGARGACEVFSFHATKPFGIGEGGLITTTNKDLVPVLEGLKNFGFNDQKETAYQGLNAKITELDCAIGLRTLSRYDKTLADRRQTHARFQKNLESYNVRFLPRAETAAIQFATILIEDKTKRDHALRNLSEDGVDARTYYAPAVHTFPLFANTKSVSLVHTEDVSDKVISLPVHPDMEPGLVDRICASIIRSM